MASEKFRGARLNNFSLEYPFVLVPEDGTDEQCVDFLVYHVWTCRGHRMALTILPGNPGRAYCFECCRQEVADKAINAAATLLGPLLTEDPEI